MKLRLVGAAEIQELLGVSRQRTYIIVARRDFPEPYATLKMGNIWLLDDVERWIAERRPHLREKNET